MSCAITYDHVRMREGSGVVGIMSEDDHQRELALHPKNTGVDSGVTHRSTSGVRVLSRDVQDNLGLWTRQMGNLVDGISKVKACIAYGRTGRVHRYCRYISYEQVQSRWLR